MLTLLPDEFDDIHFIFFDENDNQVSEANITDEWVYEQMLVKIDMRNIKSM